MHSSRKLRRSLVHGPLEVGGDDTVSGPYYAPSQTGCRWRLGQGTCKVGKVDEGDGWAGALGEVCFQLLNEVGRLVLVV